MKRTLKIILVPAAIIVAVYLVLRPGRSAPFQIDKTSVERIDLVLGARTPTSYPEPAVPYYSHSITGRQDLANIVDVLASAEPTKNHRCSYDIMMTVTYATGEQRRLDPLPGHDLAFYEFRAHPGIYRIDRSRLFSALSVAGADTNLLTEEALVRGSTKGSTTTPPTVPSPAPSAGEGR